MKLIVFLLFINVSFTAVAEKATPVIAYQTVKTLENLSFIAVGQSHALQSIDIKMPTSGRIKNLNFKAGQKVKKGDVLLTQYSDLLSVQRKRDQLLIKKLTKKSKRNKKSKKKRALSYAYQDAVIALEKTEILIGEKQFIAPFSGVVGFYQQSVGALITPDTVISTLDNVDKIRVRFEISEARIKQVTKGTKIRVYSKYDKKLAQQGNVEFIDSRLNKNTRTLMVEAVIDNSKGSIKPGMFLNVNVQVEKTLEQIFIPKTAVLTLKTKHYVFIVKKGMAVKTKVALGKRKGKTILITNGLQGTEKIIALGVSQIKNQQNVEVIDLLSSVY
jgi:membrane fusion protein (multidrug efflux system)